MASSDADRPSWESGIEEGRVDGIGGGRAHHMLVGIGVRRVSCIVWGRAKERLRLRGSFFYL